MTTPIAAGPCAQADTNAGQRLNEAPVGSVPPFLIHDCRSYPAGSDNGPQIGVTSGSLQGIVKLFGVQLFSRAVGHRTERYSSSEGLLAT